MRWIWATLIPVVVAFAAGAWVVKAMPGTWDQWVEIGKIVAPLVALLGAWYMWLYDQRKRYDPLRQEVYRQKALAYCEVLDSIGDMWESQAGRDKERFLEALARYTSVSVKRGLFMDLSVANQLRALSDFALKLYLSWTVSGHNDSTIGAFADESIKVFEAIMKALAIRPLSVDLEKLSEIRSQQISDRG